MAAAALSPNPGGKSKTATWSWFRAPVAWLPRRALATCSYTSNGQRQPARMPRELDNSAATAASYLWDATRFGIMAGGKPAVAIRVDSPDTYDVTVPYWCAGITPEGDSVKRKGGVVVGVHRKGDGAGWEVLKSEFRDQSPLSFWRQLFAYLGWVALAGLLLTFAAALLSAMSGSEKTPHVISALATVFVCWYVASVTFGSTLAVAVLVSLGILGAITRIAQLNKA